MFKEDEANFLENAKTLASEEQIPLPIGSGIWQIKGILFVVVCITVEIYLMKNRLMAMADRILLRHRAIIESVIDQLKNISQIEHFRHRSVANFFVNVLCGLIAYCRKPTKPSLGLVSLLSLPA